MTEKIEHTDHLPIAETHDGAGNLIKKGDIVRIDENVREKGDDETGMVDGIIYWRGIDLVYLQHRKKNGKMERTPYSATHLRKL